MRLHQVIAAVLIFLSISVFGDSAWQRSMEKDGILIETRQVAGSAFKEFRATMIANAPLSKAIHIMKNITQYTTWMKDCKEAREIRRISASSGIVYSLQATPWPIAEREAVVRYDFHRRSKPSSLMVQIIAEPDSMPATPGRVRITKLKGGWSFTELSPGQLQIVYSLHSEPGGNLPDWAVAGMVAHLPYETLRKLRERLEQ